MPAAKTVLHYFVVNQNGSSADRRGPFESEEAATHWAETKYKDFPAWIVPAKPVGAALKHKVLDRDGNPKKG